MRKLAAVFAVVGILGATTLAPVAAAESDHKCSPGQHGNPQPGFKPGSC